VTVRRATAAAVVLLLVSGQGTAVAGHRTIDGVATWYDDGPGLYAAAGPSLRHGDWRGSRVRVCAGDRCVDATLRDWCACGSRRGVPTVLDLSPAAFRRLAPLSRGVVHVRVSAAEGHGVRTSPTARPDAMPTPVAPRSVEMNGSLRWLWWVLIFVARLVNLGS